MGSCAAPSAKGDDKFITTDYLQQCPSPLEQLKKGPVTVSGPAFTEALERYIRLRNLEFSRLNFTGLPAIQLRNLARYAGMPSVKYIA